MKPIKAVIFDCDGVILNTEPLFDEVYQLFSLDRTGKAINEDRLKELKTMLIGRSFVETIDVLCHEIGIKLVSIKEFRAFQDPHLLERLPHAPFIPGVEELVLKLSENYRAPIAIATSAPRHYFLIKISKRRDFFRRFNVIVTADDVTVCKPAPDLYLTAAKRLGVKPENCLVFEDAPSGVEAADRAGMTCVAIPPPGVDWKLYKGACIVASSLAGIDLDEFLWDVPGRKREIVLMEPVKTW